MSETPLPRRQSAAGTLLVVVLVVASLYLARDVLIPLALALLLSFLLAPLVSRLRRYVGRVPAIIVVVLLTFSFLGAIGWLVAHQAAEITQDLPKYRDNIISKVRSVRSTLLPMRAAGSTFAEITRELVGAPAKADPDPNAEQALAEAANPAGARATDAEPDAAAAAASDGPNAAPATAPVKVEIVNQPPNTLTFLRGFLGPLLSPLGSAVIVIVFVIFMLLQLEDLRDRFIRLIGSSQLNTATEALSDAARGVSRYLLMQVIVNGSYGATVAVGLMIIGLPGALLWGLICAVIRFVPYIGPWIGASFPILLSLAVYGNWQTPLIIIGMFVVIELLSNNVMEPWLYGTQTGASPLAIIVSAVFWTWLWGGVGLLLATPMTVCLVVLGRYVPQFEFLATLLGDQPVLSPAVRFYQRLLAQDRADADEIVEDARERLPALELYEQVFVPALAQMERDRHRGALSAQREEFVHKAVRELIEECGAWYEAAGRKRARTGGHPAAAAALPADAAHFALCIPARDKADELVARMLAQVLNFESVPARASSMDMLAGEVMETIRTAKPKLVCISALPPSTFSHARYLFKRLGDNGEPPQIVVGLWGAAVDPQRIARQLGPGPRVEVVNALPAAVRIIKAWAQTAPEMTPPPAPPPPRRFWGRRRGLADGLARG